MLATSLLLVMAYERIERRVPEPKKAFSQDSVTVVLSAQPASFEPLELLLPSSGVISSLPILRKPGDTKGDTKNSVYFDHFASAQHSEIGDTVPSLRSHYYQLGSALLKIQAADEEPKPVLQGGPVDSATVETQSIAEPVSIEKALRDAFAKVRGELSEEEFTSPAVSRMLLEKISDLQSQLRDEKPFRARFYHADKDKAVLEEKFKTRISSEVMFGVCLSAGSVLISVAPTLPAASGFPTILIATGILLFVGAVISRIIVLKKNDSKN